MSIRSRLLVTIVLLMALGLALAGVTGFHLACLAVEQEARTQLVREAHEFTALATTGVDPHTRESFASASPLLRTAIERRTLGPADGIVSVVDGEIEWTAYSVATLRLEDHATFLAEVLPLVELDTTTQGRVTDAGHDFLYMVTPVRFPETGETGGLVRAVDLIIATEQLRTAFQVYAGVAVGVLALTALVAWAVMGRLLAPIVWLRRTAQAAGEGDLSQRLPVYGTDDLSTLTRTINGMLDQIESLVEGQLQLADDIGHELRTPLTILRGHLQIMDPEDVEEVCTTRVLALKEIDRMGRLTEELILLATAEKADYIITQDTDVAALTTETAALARALDERPWEVECIAHEIAPLDPQRIRQAWLQLIDNAVKYSPPGSAIGVGSEVRPDGLWLWVRDRGPGIGPTEREAVRERSVRGRVALSSGRRGRGLGLAIVTKIVLGHDGRLDIADAEGCGSVVSMVLPYHPTTGASVPPVALKQEV